MEGQRGISPVVGSVLMLALVILLTAVIGGMAVDTGNMLGNPPPQFSLEVTDYSPSGEDNHGKPYLEVYHKSGEIADGTDVYIKDGDGNTVAWKDVWTAAPRVGPGSYVHIDGYQSDGALNQITSKGQTYYIIFEGSGGETIVEKQVTIPTAPDPST